MPTVRSGGGCLHPGGHADQLVEAGGREHQRTPPHEVLIATGCRWNRLDHSITWSARAGTDCGTVRPIVAVLEIDEQLGLLRLLDEQVSGLGATPNLIDEGGRAPCELKK